MMKTPTTEQLLAENAELRARLDEAEQTLDAIRGGDVDAVVVTGPKGEQIFSLVGAESIYRLVVETMKEAAFTVTFDGTILFCNSQFGEFVQRPMEQIVGHRLHEFVAPDNVTSADSLLILSGKQPLKQRLVLWNSQEQRVPVHISANVLDQPDGPSLCIVASDLTELENSTDLIQQLRRQQEALRDSRIAALNLMKDAVETRQQVEQANEKLRQEITERRRAEEALRASEAALRDLNATLESKVAQRTAELERRARQLQKLTLELSLSEDRERKRIAQVLHDDLQQMLVAAKFHLNLLKNRAAQVPGQQAIAVKVDEMLKDAIAKSRSLSHELSPALLHRNDLAETFAWLANQMREKHGLMVRVDAPDQMELQSEAITLFLLRAAQEMLFNVIKHAGVDEARIRVRRRGRCIFMSVSDRGRGFDARQQKETGGFGLFNIRERVELLGGRMKIKSVPGKGSTFHLVVPDDQKTQDSSKLEVSRGRSSAALHTTHLTPQVPEGRPSASRLRVLLADDHPVVRQGIASLLREEHDIEVVAEAATGHEAVELANRLHPDVVVMDVSMPLMSGDEATRHIKRHLPQTRVVAISVYDEAEIANKMREAGAESYVLKMCLSDDLLAAIRGQNTSGS